MAIKSKSREDVFVFTTTRVSCDQRLFQRGQRIDITGDRWMMTWNYVDISSFPQFHVKCAGHLILFIRPLATCLFLHSSIQSFGPTFPELTSAIASLLVRDHAWLSLASIPTIGIRLRGNVY